MFRLPIYAGDYTAAQQSADVVIRQRLRNQNLIPAALEPRSVLAEFDDGAGTVTVHSSTQSPHIIKRMLAEVLSFPEERLRVVAPDVGGGFGSKLHLYPEEVLVTALAIRLRRAVKWTATRSEDFRPPTTAVTTSRTWNCAPAPTVSSRGSRQPCTPTSGRTCRTWRRAFRPPTAPRW